MVLVKTERKGMLTDFAAVHLSDRLAAAGFPIGQNTVVLDHHAITGTYIDCGSPNTNYSGVTYVDAARLYSITRRRPLIKFDLSSLSGVSSVSQAVYWTYGHVLWAGDRPFRVYGVITPWVVTEATWNECESGVSWDSPGLTAGVDYYATEITHIDISGPERYEWFEWNITSAVNNWLSGTWANEGLYWFVDAGTSIQEVEWYVDPGVVPDNELSYLEIAL